MNQEIKQQWIEALRSGDYVQCTSMLRNDSDEYCVNGVLCDLHARAYGTHNWERIGLRRNWHYLLAHSFPNVEVMHWAGLDQTELGSLEYLNDRERRTFAELADFIEANL